MKCLLRFHHSNKYKYKSRFWDENRTLNNHTSNCATQGFCRQPPSVTQYRTEKSCRRCGEEQCVLIARYEPREQICTRRRQCVRRAANECNLNLRQVSSVS